MASLSLEKLNLQYFWSYNLSYMAQSQWESWRALNRELGMGELFSVKGLKTSYIEINIITYLNENLNKSYKQ